MEKIKAKSNKKEKEKEGPLTETIEVELKTLSHRCPLFLLKMLITLYPMTIYFQMKTCSLAFPIRQVIHAT